MVAGVGIMGVGLIIYFRSRTSRILAMIAILAGVAVVIVGAQPTLIRHIISWRLRFVMLAASLAILYITFDRIRHASLKERYALLWIGTSLGFFLLALFPDIIIRFIQISGMQYTTTIMLLVFLFLLLITFHFSLALSRGEDDRRRLAQDLALLEEKVRRMSEQAGAAPDGEGRKRNPAVRETVNGEP